MAESYVKVVIYMKAKMAIINHMISAILVLSGFTMQSAFTLPTPRKNTPINHGKSAKKEIKNNGSKLKNPIRSKVNPKICRLFILVYF